MSDILQICSFRKKQLSSDVPESSKLSYQIPRPAGLRQNLPFKEFNFTRTALCLVLCLIFLILPFGGVHAPLWLNAPSLPFVFHPTRPRGGYLNLLPLDFIPFLFPIPLRNLLKRKQPQSERRHQT